MSNITQKHIISIGCIVILAFVAYSNTFDSDWHFDDNPNIIKNYSVHATTLSEIWNARHINGTYARYCGFVSFAFNWYFHGKSVTGYHVTNLLIHIAVMVLVYCSVFLTLTLPSFKKVSFTSVWLVSLFTALLWGLSPIQTEAVTYIVQRLTSLAALFFMLSLVLFIKGRRCMLGRNTTPGIVFMCAALVMYMLAMLTKENTIMLPFLILLYEHLFVRRMRTLKDRRIAALILILVAGFIFIAIARPGVLTVITKITKDYEKREFTLNERVLTQFRVIVRYLTLIVFPHPARLNLDYNFQISENIITPITTLFSILFIFGSIIFAIFARNKYPLISFCIFWFYVNNAIESTVIALEIIFEHRVYIPSIGIILMIVVLLFRFAERDLGCVREEAV
ncbi:hypothetical protein ACFL6F_01910 [Planctomycetota bacterium]